MLRTLVLLLSVVLVVPAFAGSQVRVAHLSPDAGAVDVYVDGIEVLRDVEFSQVSGYLVLGAGSYDLEVRPAGGDIAVIEATVTLDDGVAYTVAATGLVDDETLAPLVLVDDRDVEEGADPQVRFTHASPDAPTVDIAVANNGPELFTEQSFRDSSDYIGVGADTYDLDVLVSESGITALSLSDITVEQGVIYDVFAVGLVDDETLTAVVVVTAEYTAEPAQVRVAHLSPDAPNVDVYVDGEIVLEDVPFLAVSPYLNLEAGDYDVEVTVTGEADPVIDATLTLDAGTAYTVAATGLVEDDDLSPIVLVDDREVDPDNAKVRFVHTSPDAPPVDIFVVDGDAVFSDYDFREASDTLALAPGTVDLEVRVAGTDTVALELPDVELVAGINATIFAVGLLDDESLSALPTVVANGVFIRGDADRSDDLSLVDAFRILEYMFIDASTPICFDAGDFDDDGHLSITDALGVLEYLYLDGPDPQSPFPEVGTDSSADDLDCETI